MEGKIIGITVEWPDGDGTEILGPNHPRFAEALERLHDLKREPDVAHVDLGEVNMFGRREAWRLSYDGIQPPQAEWQLAGERDYPWHSITVLEPYLSTVADLAFQAGKAQGKKEAETEHERGAIFINCKPPEPDVVEALSTIWRAIEGRGGA